MSEQKLTKAQEIEAFEKEMATAKRRREVNRGLRQKYRDDPQLQSKTRKALIDDLLRVFNDVANPYRGWAASRKRYRQLGHFPEIMVEDFFGNHEEFQRAAGLRDSRETTKVRNKAALLHTHQQVAAYAEQHVLKHVGMYDRLKGRKPEHLEVLVGSDFHSYFCDPFAWQVFKDVASMVIAPQGRDGVIVVNGDLVDFPTISRHRKMPGHFHLNLHQEREMAKTMLRELRELCPEATIYFVIGNHEYRLVTYLADCAPELACLPELEFDKFFGLHEFEVSLVCKSSFLAPSAKARRRDVRLNWLDLYDCFVFAHGTSIADNAAQVELTKHFNRSGSSGHTHRPQVASSNSLGTGPIRWMSTPMMAGYAVGRDYVNTPSQWQMGFGVVSMLPRKGLSSPALVWIHDDWAAFGGRSWTPTKEALRKRQEQNGV